MPYDPRHESEGGNRTTTRKDLIAPKRKFRVILVDTFEGGDCVVGDFSSRKRAIETANQKGGQMTKVYVYNDKGQQIHSAGTY